MSATSSEACERVTARLSHTFPKVNTGNQFPQSSALTVCVQLFKCQWPPPSNPCWLVLHKGFSESIGPCRTLAKVQGQFALMNFLLAAFPRLNAGARIVSIVSRSVPSLCFFMASRAEFFFCSFSYLRRGARFGGDKHCVPRLSSALILKSGLVFPLAIGWTRARQIQKKTHRWSKGETFTRLGRKKQLPLKANH